MISFTAKYSRISSGYMGQLIEWPEVITEGANLEACRVLLHDALKEMVMAYKQAGKKIPEGNFMIEQVTIEADYVGKAA